MSIQRFLEAIWPNDSDFYGEIRSIKDGVVSQHFDLLSRIGRLADLAQADSDLGHDVYYGVLPRTFPRGTADSCVPWTHVLWSDIDAKHHSEDLAEGKRIALAKAMSVTPEPQIVVDSGGGTHAYWLLRDPVDYVDAREIMTGVARQIGGDHVQDAPRVLRVPGTWNYKRTPEVYARVIRFAELSPRYRIGDFTAYMAAPKARRSENGAFLRTDLPEWLLSLIDLGAPKGSRSEQVFKAVITLMRCGRSDDEIRSVVRATPEGIGAKYAEMNEQSAERWLDRTIQRARFEA